MISAERLRELIEYGPETGIFVWRVRRSGVTAGAVAGSPHSHGYQQIRVDGTIYLSHRLAWLHFYGVWPTGQIDHRDGDRANNRIANLRDVTRSVNGQNQRRAMSTNKSCGLLGVNSHQGRWRARIRIDGKYRCLGLHDTPELAHDAYITAKRIYHEGCTI